MREEIKRSKFWPIIVELLEEYFPKGKCKERGQAMLLIAEIEKMMEKDLKNKRKRKTSLNER